MGILVPDGDGDGIEIFIPVVYGPGMGMDVEIGMGMGNMIPEIPRPIAIPKTTKRLYGELKIVSQDISSQLNAEAEAVQIILTGVDNDIYSTVELIATVYRNRGKAFVTSSDSYYDPKPTTVTEDVGRKCQGKEIDKLRL
ncbi:hypothetical protein Tco_0608858 [Tanacetum coccineum]